MRDKQNDSNVINVKVTVQQTGSTYNATYDPPVIPVKEHNTVIRFHLDEETPDKIVIDNVTITPLGQTQLSSPEISSNRKKVEVTDKNTVKETFHLNFTYKDKQSEAATFKCADDNGVEYPQVENDPPGSP
jgi:hypothetical protein